MPSRSPFDVLGISTSAEPEVVSAAYRALAKKYHPDVNAGVDASELNRRMAELNWAKAELDRDLNGWRLRPSQPRVDARPARGSTRTPGAPRPAAKKNASHTSSVSPVGGGAPIEVDQALIFVPGKAGATAEFQASSPQAGAVLRARVAKESLLELERLSTGRNASTFRVRLAADVPSTFDSSVEIIELRGAGLHPLNVYVCITPVTEPILAQTLSEEKIASPRHVTSSARIPFGRHRARRFSEIALEEPGYLQWVIREGAGGEVVRKCAQLALEEVGMGQPSTTGKRTRSKTKQLKSAAPAAKRKTLNPSVSDVDRAIASLFPEMSSTRRAAPATSNAVKPAPRPSDASKPSPRLSETAEPSARPSNTVKPSPRPSDTPAGKDVDKQVPSTPSRRRGPLSKIIRALGRGDRDP